ncbi:glycosyltransferase family 2 protein [Saccharophagus degradans]|uniref:Glycosyltransferase family 2 protein n=1 Tax=Saccharophagus degradans TaxID=86304 RepID=A0AAW7XC51_9GAMM|nr:glycosyltransferase family 2 protein [Saccharophagus degradans]MBU2984190.1 glycosyltransferase family 2 protein [Saccharophagus degradans]MDO6424151.1 glycosyltransferase family 2 protein [Saccharophagus degradans]MDO6608198.1 glycosyltransferase family 2 protein [Saccharophagus degradans]WGO96727.1 glycosyltransferase family 2 protein [Saccharophagus degradans]
MSLPSISIVVPVYNEQENIAPLFEAISESMANYDGDWDVVIVNDGSRDQTAAELNRCVKQYGDKFLHVELQRNFGQTAAMQAGIDEASGDLIATMDGDLQNDPADIPRIVKELIERDLDLLQGWRKNRQDHMVSRKLPSRLANKLIQRVSGVMLDDYGCSLKVYRADVLKQIRLYGEMHRFIPVWMATVCPPHRIGQTVVNHRARMAGESKYGISRTFRVIIDLVSVFFFLKFRARPGHFFGSIGLWVGGIGGLMLTYLGLLKFVFGQDIGNRPMLLIASLLIIASLQFLTTGVLSEILSRIFFQTTNVKSYTVRKPLTCEYSAQIQEQKAAEKIAKQEDATKQENV